MADSTQTTSNNNTSSSAVVVSSTTSTKTNKVNRTNDMPRTLENTKQLLKQSMDKEIYVNIENSNGTVNFFAALIFLSFIVKFVFGGTSSDGNTGDASTTLWSYSIILLSLICILVLQTIIPKTYNSTSDNIGSIFPIILTIVAFMWSLTMNLKYYKKLNKGEIAKEYYAWSKMSSMFLMIQTLLLVAIVKGKFNYILSGDYTKSGTENNKGKIKILFGNIFFLIIIFIVLGIQQVILDKFTVDG